MEAKDFNTKEENTWCPGCPNMGISQAAKTALAELVNEEKIKAKDIVISTGIGCHAKMYDYINVNGFYGLHGRTIPVALGIKIGNPELTVVGFGGDGDTYAEGIAHFVQNCKHNANMTMLVHDNQTFSLTTGQSTPTSEKGFIGASTPFGETEDPINPITLALASGASFVARSYALDPVHLKETIKKAIEHKGFSFVEIIQPCIIFHNTVSYFKDHIYKLEDNDSQDFSKALELSREWDYSFDKDKKVSMGTFYEIKKATFEDRWSQLGKPSYLIDRKIDWGKLSKEFK
ncbi:MAG: thiamine pyrophosphate-dependent enzyme [Candidatus Nealsonbacteria bacterium]